MNRERMRERKTGGKEEETKRQRTWIDETKKKQRNRRMSDWH